jgi:peptidoglycan hydrolase-like protein with peptidoglycan-binding domain
MIGIGNIMGIGLKIIANRDKIAAVWSELIPVIQTVREQYPKMRGLLDDIAPDVVDQTKPTEKEPMSVSWLQESLNSLGADPELEVDGKYGEATKDAVAQYQEEHPPLVVDGWAGAATQASIYEELSKRD